MRRFVMVMALMSIITILFTIIISTIDQSSSEPIASQAPAAQHHDSNRNYGQQSHSNDISLEEHTRKILVPRVSGTAGNIEVRGYIVDNLKKYNYHLELDEFEWSTPVGNVKFANIIATSNPKACRQLVLACHYDSKKMAGFLGAIDSAVPCAMLLVLAKTFSKSFRPDDQDPSGASIGLRFIFFDGEEPFVEWTKSDSLYGSRHLAAKWARQAVPQECRRSSGSHKYRNELDRIELFVLLDLIGTPDTTFVQFSSAVKHHYEALQKHEREHILKVKPNLSSTQLRRHAAFDSRMLSASSVEDDHVPFKERGVPVLHLIAVPFPRVWHTVGDNYEAIDFARTRRILHALEQFVANYSRIDH